MKKISLYIYYSLFLISVSHAQITVDFSAIQDRTIDNINDLNTEALEFSPSFYDNGILYISTGEKGRSYDKTINEAYFKLRLYPNDHDRSIELNYQINQVREHIGPSHYDDLNDVLYYTQSKKSRKGNKRPVNQILRSERDSLGWKSGVEIDINQDEWSIQHPTVSLDGKTIVFSSNAPDGIGSYDLYWSTWQDTAWSAPSNLGAGVNSFDNEAFPFLYQDSILFFASNGKGGVGSYDIFVSVYKDGEWQNAQNLGKRINTKEDDFGFILSTDALTAYFSSNRIGGKGKDDIYKASFTKPIINISEVIRSFPKVKREFYDMQVYLQEASTGNGIEEAFVTLLPFREDNELSLNAFDVESIDAVDGESRFLMNIIPKSNSDSLTHLTDEMGSTLFQIEKNKNYLLTIQKEGYKPYTTAIDGAELIPEVTVNIEKITSEKVNLKLIEIEEEQENKTPEVIETSIPSEEVTNPFENVEIAVFDQIYYDYNSSKISPNSTGQLDQLAAYMKTYPDIKVELIAHTDSRGRQDFNLQLSLDRAQEAKAYLVKKGISDFRVKAFGKGEDDIRNHCTNGVFCTESEHEFNRRTEVRVIIE